jgi:inhibitor of cysteine peptidase
MWNSKPVMVVTLGLMVIAAIVGTALAEEAGGTEVYGDLKKFESKEEIRDFLKENVGYYGGYTRDSDSFPAGAVFEQATSAPMPTFEPAPDSKSGADDYSTTNLQVQGVDEADFVKNDGKYIYILSGGTLAILDAYPAETARIISETPVDGDPKALFLAGDRLVVMATAEERVMVTPEGSVTPVPVWRTVTHAYVYTIRDRTAPELVRDLTFTGNYYGARMIGEYVYALTSEYPVWLRDDIVLPEVRADDAPAVMPDIYYPTSPADNYIFYTASGFSVRNDRIAPDAETFLLGYGTTLYVSQENMFIGYRSIGPGYADPVREASTSARNTDRTIIHRFAIGGGKINYQAMGEVPGHLLNQFSLDEYRGNLRVATTVEGWTQRGSVQYNNVYVLDADMKTVGELENIAPDERIYATRFVGDRLYMVTFKRIDPLFVIDLSDPKHPGILGKLKIPGYSDYLHPYDADHLIGVGKETTDNGWGGVSVGGVKIALFDVSDVNDPRQIDTVEIGEAGTDSEALRDHKAFLFSREKDLLVIPISEIRRVENPTSQYGAYGTTTWQGAYVFSVNPTDGFTVRGTVTHREKDPSYYWGSSDAVRRSLYMGDTLYTISQRSIIITDLDEIAVKVKEVTLPYREATYPSTPYRGE